MAKQVRAYNFDTGNVLYNGKPVSDDSILIKFVVFQAMALCFAALHGVFQRMPFMAEWLRESDYGGHLITNLGLTHVNVVAGGTVAIAGITYYVLPRVLQRPMYSRTLCNLSFWFTTIGVMSFYFSLWPIGLSEGNLVQQGYTYAQAKDIVGFWHKFPEAVSASIMGIGYWLYVTNVVVTIWKSRRDVRNRERFEAKFHLVATISLLLGTLQGVYQVLPWSLDWLYKTGAAGQLIDPASHSHMNLIGGCVLAFMGFMYYFLPRITGHPIFSVRLANFSFWATFIGVYTFWLTFITLGFIEGDKVIREGITAQAAKESMGIWHALPISMAGSIVALGLWSFIANVLLTLKIGLGEAKERYIAIFLGISTVCLFVSTTQGIIQIQSSTARWIEQAREGGEMVFLVAHPQMNIIGVISLTLISLGTYVVPRMVGRRLYSHKLAKFYLTLLAVSVFTLYITTLTLGILEGNVIRQGKSFAQARQEITGGWHDFIFLALYLLIGICYACYATNVIATVGKAKLAEGFCKVGNNLNRLGGRVININMPATSMERAKREAKARLSHNTGGTFSQEKLQNTTAEYQTPNRYAADSGTADSGSEATKATVRQYVVPPRRILEQNPFGIIAVEIVAGWIGFLGVGWLKSRRPAMAMALFVIWQTVFWVCLWAVVVLLAPDQLFTLAIIYLILPIISGIAAALTYRSSAQRIKAEIQAAVPDSPQTQPSEIKS